MIEKILLIRRLTQIIMEKIGLGNTPEFYKGSFLKLKRNQAIQRLRCILELLSQQGVPVLPLETEVFNLLFQVSASESVSSLKKTWKAIHDTIVMHLVLFDDNPVDREKGLLALKLYLQDLCNK